MSRCLSTTINSSLGVGLSLFYGRWATPRIPSDAPYRFRLRRRCINRMARNCRTVKRHPDVDAVIRRHGVQRPVSSPVCEQRSHGSLTVSSRTRCRAYHRAAAAPWGRFSHVSRYLSASATCLAARVIEISVTRWMTSAFTRPTTSQKNCRCIAIRGPATTRHHMKISRIDTTYFCRKKTEDWHQHLQQNRCEYRKAEQHSDGWTRRVTSTSERDETMTKECTATSSVSPMIRRTSKPRFERIADATKRLMRRAARLLASQSSCIKAWRCHISTATMEVAFMLHLYRQEQRKLPIEYDGRIRSLIRIFASDGYARVSANIRNIIQCSLMFCQISTASNDFAVFGDFANASQENSSCRSSPTARDSSMLW